MKTSPTPFSPRGNRCRFAGAVIAPPAILPTNSGTRIIHNDRDGKGAESPKREIYPGAATRGSRSPVRPGIRGRDKRSADGPATARNLNVCADMANRCAATFHLN